MKKYQILFITFQLFLFSRLANASDESNFQFSFVVQNLNNISPQDVVGIYKTTNGSLSFYTKGEESHLQPCVSISFTDSSDTIGWNEQSIKLHGICNPLEEFWSAGYLETYKNWKLVLYSIHNEKIALETTISDWDFYWNSIDAIVDNVRKLIVKGSSTDQFTNFVTLFQAQLDGMLAGYSAAKDPSEPNITMANLYFLNFGGSIGEMYEVFKFQKNPPSYQNSLRRQKNSRAFKNQKQNLFHDKKMADREMHGHCTAFVKCIKDNNGLITDFLFAHTTYDYFHNTIKIMKSINITIGNQTWSALFPSYPGVIYSGDDFYLTGNGLVITETTLSAYNPMAYQTVTGVNSMYPDFMRVLAATLTSKNPLDWVTQMKSTNTGTYSSQWMVLDLNSFEESLGNQALKSGTFYVAEQSTQRFLYADFSKVISDGTLPFWASFNTPYFAEILNDLQGQNPPGVQDNLVAVPYYTSLPKFQIFNEYNSQINSVDDLKKVIRLNRFGVNHNYDPVGEIACRADLGKNVDYFGASDAKIINYELAKHRSFVSQFGPTHDDITPFSWPSQIYAMLLGLPHTYDFDW